MANSKMLRKLAIRHTQVDASLRRASQGDWWDTLRLSQGRADARRDASSAPHPKTQTARLARTLPPSGRLVTARLARLLLTVFVSRQAFATGVRRTDTPEK